MSAAAAISRTAPLDFDRLRRVDAEAVAAELEGRTAQEALEWMFDTFGERHYIACSFQKTSSVTAHMATQINPEARFFYLDTDVLFPETYETRDRLAEHLGIEFDRFHNLTLEEQAEQYGDELWKQRSRLLLRPAQGRADAPRALFRRLLGRRRPPRRLQQPLQDAEVRLGQEIRPLEAEPPRGLVRARRLELHP